MKPPPFEYDDPQTLDEALALLEEHGDEAKVLAGGQSLVPMLNFRLARPERIVDVNRVGGLAGIDASGDTLRIGALTRQSALEHSPLVAAHAPLLAQAIRYVGHTQIRNRGTVGGSVAHADPAAELPAALTALDARFHVRSHGERRELSADELFVAHFITSLEPEEMLVEIEVPLSQEPSGSAFLEVARRDGDFALAGAAATVALDGDGTCRRAGLALLAAGPVPVRAREVEAWLAGQAIDAATAQEAGRRAAAGASPPANVHAGAEARRRMLATVVARTLVEAAGRAREAG